jgi:hypothetical protein
MFVRQFVGHLLVFRRRKPLALGETGDTCGLIVEDNAVLPIRLSCGLRAQLCPYSDDVSSPGELATFIHTTKLSFDLVVQ